MISQSFKNLIDKENILPVHMQLIKNSVEDSNGLPHDYYIVHIAKPMDVLDKEASVYHEDSLIKPVLNSKKIAPFRLLSFSEDSFSPNLIVSADIRDAILTQGLTGMELSTIPVV